MTLVGYTAAHSSLPIPDKVKSTHMSLLDQQLTPPPDLDEPIAPLGTSLNTSHDTRGASGGHSSG